MEAQSNKRIAKNTLFLYFRMFFGMLVSLYTSRLVLNALGVEDYGIYNVVGGVVVLLDFLNSSMSGATSRFITYELGRNDFCRLREVFSSALILHTLIALVVWLVAETLGLWFLETKLVIPEYRMEVARVVYQMSLFNMILGILQVPYNATLIAHEKMDIYAYVSILSIILKLLVAYLLVWSDFDKLLLYSLLQFGVTALIMGIYVSYCFRRYKETHAHFVWNPSLLKPMLGFSGWDLYGNASVIARTQGVSMLLNMFFGPMMNAAAGIAAQVQGAVMALAGNLVTAVRPQIVKRYAINEYDEMFVLLRYSIKISFLLLAVVTIPLLVEMRFVLILWLRQVPDYAVVFCQYTLIFNFFACISLLFACVIHATGKIKRISLINGSLYMLVLPFSLLAYWCGGDAWMSYAFNVLAVCIGMISNAWTIHLYIPSFPIRQVLLYDVGKCVTISLGVFILTNCCVGVCEEGLARLIVSIVVSAVLLLGMSYMWLLTKEEKMRVVALIKRKVWKKA